MLSMRQKKGFDMLKMRCPAQALKNRAIQLNPATWMMLPSA
jgi:hypothetical protein